MNLFIPVIGTVITLEKDWEFEFDSSYRNYNFWKTTFPNEFTSAGSSPFYAKKSRKFGFLRGTVLKFERLTVVKRSTQNGVAFTIRHDARGEIGKKLRFVVSIEDVNKIICSIGDNRGET